MAVSTGPHGVLAVGPYRLQRVLGEGGMGVVHLSHDRWGNPVAVKVLRPHVVADADSRVRLAREVATMRRVRGPHVAQVVDADVDGEQPYLVTMFVPGQSLDQLVRRGGPLPLQQLLGLGAGLADALASVHAAGVVHRDLKPGNVLVDAGRPVVIDFGIAQLVDDTALTVHGMFFGTPGYLAPEVVHGERATAASDLASWAATMTFAATGRPPYGNGPVEVVLGRTGGGLLDLSGVPEPLVPVLRAAIGPRETRPSAEQVRGWLEQLARQTPGTRLLTAPQQAPNSATYLLTGLLPGATDRPMPGPAAHPGPVAQPTRQVTAQQYPPPTWSVPPGQPAVPTYQPYGQPAPAGPQPYGPPPVPAWQQRAGRVGGALLVFGALATLAGIVALAPVIGALAVALVLLVAGMLARSARRTEARQAQRGRRRSDPVAAAALLPWQLLQSVPGVLGALITGLLGLGVGAVVGLWLGGGGGSGSSLNDLLLPAAVVGVLTAWYGPGHRHRGEATAHTAATLRPTMTAVVLLTLSLMAVALWAYALRSPVDWFPWHQAPLHRSDVAGWVPGR